MSLSDHVFPLGYTAFPPYRQPIEHSTFGPVAPGEPLEVAAHDDGMLQVVPFQPMQKIKRLFRDCTVTEKLDGTNASIFVALDGAVFAASRNRWITPEDDNYGFAAWVRDNSTALGALGPGHHFGEWWGAGIQRRYGQTEKRFSLFNVDRWSGAPLPSCVGLVPVLYDGPFSTQEVRNVCVDLERDGSRAAPGFDKPEGVVVRLHGNLYKFTFGGDGHKGTK